MGHCPGPLHRRDDKRASLHISRGRKGIVFHCFAGCAADDIRGALGLEWPDLFDGDEAPHRTPYRSWLMDGEQRTAARRRLHELHGEGCDRLHQMQDFVDALAPRLMFLPASSEADALRKPFHEKLGDIRHLESILTRIERCFR